MSQQGSTSSNQDTNLNKDGTAVDKTTGKNSRTCKTSERQTQSNRQSKQEDTGGHSNQIARRQDTPDVHTTGEIQRGSVNQSRQEFGASRTSPVVSSGQKASGQSQSDLQHNQSVTKDKILEGREEPPQSGDSSEALACQEGGASDADHSDQTHRAPGQSNTSPSQTGNKDKSSKGCEEPLQSGDGSEVLTSQESGASDVDHSDQSHKAPGQSDSSPSQTGNKDKSSKGREEPPQSGDSSEALTSQEGGAFPASDVDHSNQSHKASGQSDSSPSQTGNKSLKGREEPQQSGDDKTDLNSQEGGASVVDHSNQNHKPPGQSQSDSSQNQSVNKDKSLSDSMTSQIKSENNKDKGLDERLTRSVSGQGDSRGQGQSTENHGVCKVVGDSITNSHVHLTIKTTKLMAYSLSALLSSFFFGAIVLHTSNYFLQPHLDTTQATDRGTSSQTNENNLHTCLEGLDKMEKNLTKMEQNFSETKNDTELRMTNLLTVNKQLKEEVMKLKLKQSLIEGTQEFTEAKLITSDTFWFVAILLFFLELVMGLVLYKVFSIVKDALSDFRHRQKPTVTQNSQHHITGNQSPENQILTKVSRKTLQRSVCVLSFYSGTPHKNHILVSESFLDQGVKLKDFVVNRHEDILRVPDSKVVLVHIDYNARNIILEDPSREIGDLKRTTVLALQKMGAEVVLFYYEERTGRALENGRLYNSQLESINIHTVLKQLESRQRVISLRDGAALTDHQKHHLQTTVTSVLR